MPNVYIKKTRDELLRPETYLGEPDGTKDFEPVIRQILDRYGVCKLSQGIYSIERSIDIYSGQVLEGEGSLSVVRLINRNTPADDTMNIRVGNMKGDPSQFTEQTDVFSENIGDVYVGQTKITVSDVNNYNVGDLVWLMTATEGWVKTVNSIQSFVPAYQQINRVIAVDSVSNQIILEDPIAEEWTNVEIRKNTNTSGNFMSAYAKVGNIKFENDVDTWFRLGGTYKCSFDDIWLDVEGSGIVANGLAHCTFSNIRGVAKRSPLDIGHFGHDTVIQNCKISSPRDNAQIHMIGLFEGSRRFKVKNNSFSFGTTTQHALYFDNIDYIDFENNEIVFNQALRVINFNKRYGGRINFRNNNIKCNNANWLVGTGGGTGTDNIMFMEKNKIYVNTLNNGEYVNNTSQCLVSKDNLIDIKTGKPTIDTQGNFAYMRNIIDNYYSVGTDLDLIGSEYDHQQYNYYIRRRRETGIGNFGISKHRNISISAKTYTLTEKKGSRALTQYETVIVHSSGEYSSLNDVSRIIVNINDNDYHFSLPNDSGMYEFTFRIGRNYNQQDYLIGTYLLKTSTGTEELNYTIIGDIYQNEFKIKLGYECLNSNDFIKPHKEFIKSI